MDPAILSALSAVLGSVVGGAASIPPHNALPRVLFVARGVDDFPSKDPIYDERIALCEGQGEKTGPGDA